MFGHASSSTPSVASTKRRNTGDLFHSPSNSGQDGDLGPNQVAKTNKACCELSDDTPIHTVQLIMCSELQEAKGKFKGDMRVWLTRSDEV